MVGQGGELALLYSALKAVLRIVKEALSYELL